VRNYITNYNFESIDGWKVTSAQRPVLTDEPTITNCYGRFSNNKFHSMIDDFLAGTYSESYTYEPYIEVKFTKNDQFVLNSGLRDNRTTIMNLPKNKELVLDCNILDSAGKPLTDNNRLKISIGEYKYIINSGGY
jgi:hypothetical protein